MSDNENNALKPDAHARVTSEQHFNAACPDDYYIEACAIIEIGDDLAIFLALPLTPVLVIEVIYAD